MLLQKKSKEIDGIVSTASCQGRNRLRSRGYVIVDYFMEDCVAGKSATNPYDSEGIKGGLFPPHG